MKNSRPGRQFWPESVSRPLATPLQPSVVYTAASPDALDAQYEGVDKGYTYAREGHPNAEALCARLNALETADHGLVTGSGMAAVTTALFAILKSGDHAIGGSQLYGRSLRLFTQELPRLGIETSLIDPSAAKNVADAIRPNTKLILVETISNPGLRVADVDAIIGLGRNHGIRVLVDNTFATPRAYRPLERGADIVIESVTKILGGHSDATLGYVGTNEMGTAERLTDVATTTGMTPSPFDCWLAERGLLTFGLRFDRASQTAEMLAARLAAHPVISKVFYPMRADHPDFARSKEILSGGSHMVSFEIRAEREISNKFVEALGDVAFAPTLGDVATTLSHPASSSHRALTDKERAEIGLSEGFFRVSVGCEEPTSLVESFERALSAIEA